MDNPKFTITVHRKPWNKTAQAALDIAQSIAENPDVYEVSTIAEFSIALKLRLMVWCKDNKKDPSVIDISKAVNWRIYINRPNSTEGAAICIVLNHIGHIVYGPHDSGKTGTALNIPMRMGLNYEWFNAQNFEPEFIDNSPEYFKNVTAIIIDECPADYPTRFIEHIKKGKILFVFISQTDKPQVPEHSPFLYWPCYVRS